MAKNDKDSEIFDKALKYVQEHVTEESLKRAPELMKTLGLLYFKLRDSKLMKEANIFLDEAALAHACSAFFADIFRIEAFHAVNPADNHKKAAHIFRWISRFRPVRPKENSPTSLKGSTIIANAMFAVLCAFSFLNIKAFTPSSSERDHIIYSSIYRDIDPRDWAMIFYQLEMRHPEKPSP